MISSDKIRYTYHSDNRFGSGKERGTAGCGFVRKNYFSPPGPAENFGKFIVRK